MKPVPGDHDSASPPSLTNEEVGKRLKALRDGASLTRKQLADAATPQLTGASIRGGALTYQAILRVERGVRALKYTEAIAVAAVLGVGVDELNPEWPSEGVS